MTWSPRRPRFPRVAAALFAALACLLLESCGPASTGAALSGADAPPSTAPDTLPVEAPFTSELQPDTIRADAPGREDCNGNGLPDFVDLREGNEEDANHNGIIDPCEPDTTLLAHSLNTRWRTYAFATDSSFFWIGYQRRARAEGGEVVAIRYTVPRGGAVVRLDVFDARGADIATLVSGRQDSGAYETAWHRDWGRSHSAPAGAYRLRLQVGARTYVRHTRWAR